MTSHAYFMTGNDLVDLMRDWERGNQKSANTDYTKATSFTNYNKGVYDSLELNNRICPNNINITTGQVSALVAKYLAANPERWNEPAYFLVADALMKAFQCKK